MRHARTQLEVILSFNGACLRIAVTDGNPRPPMARAREELTAGGWGLTLIESLSTEWGTDVAGADGKTVWFEIDTSDVDVSPGQRGERRPT